MNLHVLPGDSLVAQFAESGIDGETVVFREALIAGDVSGATLDEFWDVRANFVALEYGGDPIEYQEKVAYEVERLLDVTADDSIFLWFEYELFCQSNMWFLLDLLSNSPARIFRVQPLNALPDNVWDGFAASTSDDLRKCFDDAEEFSNEDISTGQKLWDAFRVRNAAALLTLGDYRSPRFPFLKEVCEAAAQIEVVPERVIREIWKNGARDIETIFPEFKKLAPVYGYGDLQVERILLKMELA